MKWCLRILLPLALVIFSESLSLAQCAMCRATLENNVSNGHIGIAEGINIGILYLFAMPYIAVMVLGYMWYRRSKSSNEPIQSSF